MTTPVITADAGLAGSFRRQGGIIMAVFALLWAVLGTGWLGDGPGYWTSLAVAVAVSATLVVLAVRRRTPAVPREVPGDWRRRYNLAVLAELVLGGAVAVALGLTGLPGLIPAGVALVVGAHFWPLARVFGQRQYRWTGLGLCLIAVAGLAGFLLGGDPAAQAVTGTGAALVLWATSLVVTRAD